MTIILVAIEYKVDTWTFSNNSMNIVSHRLRFKLWKILQEMGVSGHLTCLLRNLYAGLQVKKQQLEQGMEQQTGSKLGEEYVKAVYCHPAYLTFMQSTSWEMLDWIKHKLELKLKHKIARRNINNLRYAGDTTLTAESEEELKSFLEKVEEESEKVGLKLNIQKTKIIHPVPTVHGK